MLPKCIQSKSFCLLLDKSKRARNLKNVADQFDNWCPPSLITFLLPTGLKRFRSFESETLGRSNSKSRRSFPSLTFSNLLLPLKMVMVFMGGSPGIGSKDQSPTGTCLIVGLLILMAVLGLYYVLELDGPKAGKVRKNLCKLQVIRGMVCSPEIKTVYFCKSNLQQCALIRLLVLQVLLGDLRKKCTQRIRPPRRRKFQKKLVRVK